MAIQNEYINSIISYASDEDTADNIRGALSTVRQRLKDSPETLNGLTEPENLDFVIQALGDEDPKARKNAALLLGDIMRAYEMTDEACIHIINALIKSYGREETLFVRPCCLKAIDESILNRLKSSDEVPADAVGKIQEQLRKRLSEIDSSDIAADERKHVLAERGELIRLTGSDNVSKNAVHASFKAVSWHSVLLYTESEEAVDLIEKSVRGIPGRKLTRPYGVELEGTDSNLRQIRKIRTYDSLLYRIRIKKDHPFTKTSVGDSLKVSEFSNFFRRFFTSDLKASSNTESDNSVADEASADSASVDGVTTSSSAAVVTANSTDTRPGFFVMVHREKSDYAKRMTEEIAFAMKDLIRPVSLSSADIVLHFFPKKDMTFFMYAELAGSDDRFSYRTETTDTSMAPVKAARMVYSLIEEGFIEPRKKFKRRVIDPFAGTGTLLTERMIADMTHVSFALDTFNDAVKIGREQAVRAGVDINYVHRDFFTFTTDTPFDEIITELPDMYMRLPEEKEEFFINLFDEAEKVLSDSGYMFLLTSEGSRVSAQVRKNKCFRFIKEISFEKKRSIYVIQKITDRSIH